MIFDEFADARRAVDMRYDLEQEIGCSQRSAYCREIGLPVLVAHGANGNLQQTVVQPANQRVDLRLEGGLGKFLGKAPEFTAACDGRMVVEKHAVRVAALKYFRVGTVGDDQVF